MELPFNFHHFLWAVGLGGLSAASLPLGSALGLFWQPRSRITAAFTAFGGGALLAALSIELVSPVAHAFLEASQHAQPGMPTEEMRQATVNLVAVLIGALVGGMVFVVLDQIVNARGGFLRKTATTISFLGKRRARRHKEILEMLSGVEVLCSVPPEHVERLVESTRPVRFDDGEVLFREGQEGDRLYFIKEGGINLLKEGKPFKELGAGEILGEIALLTGGVRTATARAKGSVTALVLLKEDFDHLRQLSPELEEATAKLASRRIEELSVHETDQAHSAAEWAARATKALRDRTTIPSQSEVIEAKEEHSGAPLAIWLGILLDGIPESFVIGAGLVGMLALHAGSDIATVGFLSVIPWTLIAGLFLSTFPEAMSSSVGMGKQGWRRGKIFFLWFSLMVITALGAGVGYWLGGGAPEWIVVTVRGLAAGAMLTMIASTMVPEAVHLGGPTVTGLGTLSGFLGAIAFKLLE